MSSHVRELEQVGCFVALLKAKSVSSAEYHHGGSGDRFF